MPPFCVPDPWTSKILESWNPGGVDPWTLDLGTLEPWTLGPLDPTRTLRPLDHSTSDPWIFGPLDLEPWNFGGPQRGRVHLFRKDNFLSLVSLSKGPGVQGPQGSWIKNPTVHKNKSSFREGAGVSIISSIEIRMGTITISRKGFERRASDASVATCSS